MRGVRARREGGRLLPRERELRATMRWVAAAFVAAVAMTGASALDPGQIDEWEVRSRRSNTEGVDLGFGLRVSFCTITSALCPHPLLQRTMHVHAFRESVTTKPTNSLRRLKLGRRFRT